MPFKDDLTAAYEQIRVLKNEVESLKQEKKVSKPVKKHLFRWRKGYSWIIAVACCLIYLAGGIVSYHYAEASCRTKVHDFDHPHIVYGMIWPISVPIDILNQRSKTWFTGEKDVKRSK